MSKELGLTVGVLNPLVVEVMKEEGIDIYHNKTKNVFDFYKEGRRFHYVITVCDEASAEKCPIFPSNSKKFKLALCRSFKTSRNRWGKT